MEATPMTVLIYESINGTAPYSQWLDALKDIQAAAKIEVRVRRIRLGNLGHWEPVGEGVAELKIDYGPGYRVYFGRIGSTIIVLLCGGDKKTQRRDIVKAKELWLDFKERYHGKED